MRPGLLAALDTAKSWQVLHAALAAHDLEIKPRGAGLVIAMKNGMARTKASSLDPKLSMKSLIRQFGALFHQTTLH